MGDTSELRKVDGGFPRSAEEREITRAVASAKTKEEYIAALMRHSGATRERAETIASWAFGQSQEGEI